MSSESWAYADRDPWHEEDDQEDEYRTLRGRNRLCRECNANLDIDGHDPSCPVAEGSDE